MDDEPSGVPAELPSDYQEFRRSYRWPLQYGPWALGIIGLVMVGVGLFADRPDGVALTSIGFGAAMVIAGVLLPRMQGQLELGPSGVKAAVHGLPTAFMVAAVTAREVAEKTIPADEPDRDRKVDEAVGHVAMHWVTMRDFPKIPPGAHPETVADWLASRQQRDLRTHPEPPTGEEAAQWTIEAIDQILATGQKWTDEDWSRWFQAKRLEREPRQKPPDDQAQDS